MRPRYRTIRMANSAWDSEIFRKSSNRESDSDSRQTGFLGLRFVLGECKNSEVHKSAESPTTVTVPSQQSYCRCSFATAVHASRASSLAPCMLLPIDALLVV
jgi:hypothetical protein